MFSIERLCFGQASEQLAHAMHLRCSISQVLLARSTLIAPVGHFFWHIPQKMHVVTSIAICPLVAGKISRTTEGYNRVAGFLNRFASVSFAMVKYAISYLSVQLMHGSMVSTMFATSAKSHPLRAWIMAGMFAKVGVRARKRVRNFVPLALT